MQDQHLREISYLRISVTDRCNLRCNYCMPPGGVEYVPHGQILRNEEIIRVINAGVKVGIRKVRLTGGEPLVRKGIAGLIKEIATVPMIDDIAITTNGVLLKGMAEELREAGLNRVNISLDTLDEVSFRQITRVGKLEDVWVGINTALEYGFHPVKINTVAMRGVNDVELLDIARLSLEYPLHVRFIELMPIGVSDTRAGDMHISAAEVRAIIEKGLGKLSDVPRPQGNGPAAYWKLPGARGTIGFITPVSDHFCSYCNRLRLTAEGKLRPCLHSSSEIDLRSALRGGAGDQELADLFTQAIKAKPHRHNFSQGWDNKDRIMSQIGG